MMSSYCYVTAQISYPVSQRAQDIVAGDVIVIQGQSNAAGQDDCRECQRLY